MIIVYRAWVIKVQCKIKDTVMVVVVVVVEVEVR